MPTPKTMPRLLLSLFAAFAVLQAPALITPAHPDDAPVIWSMSPADAANGQTRPWVELELEPGQRHTGQLMVKNHGSTEATFGLQAADGYFTEAGRFNMLSGNQPSVAAGTWIELPERVTVAAGGSELVEYTVSVPRNATPGDHAAGIASVITSTGQATGGITLGVDSRVGFRVMTRVSGTLDPSLAIGQSAASYTPSWNPLAPGHLDITHTVVNDGNLQLETSSAITAPLASHLSAPAAASVLPGASAQSAVRLERAWPLFITPVELTVSGRDSQGGQQVQEQRTIWVATPPWSQLAVLAGLALCWFGLRRHRAKKELRLAQMLQSARREGAREALEAQPAGRR